MTGFPRTPQDCSRQRSDHRLWGKLGCVAASRPGAEHSPLFGDGFAGENACCRLAGPLADALIISQPLQGALVPGSREPGIKPGNRLLDPVTAGTPGKGRVHHISKAKHVPVKAAHAERGSHPGHGLLQKGQQRDHSWP